MKYRTKPRIVAAARWPSGGRYGTVERAEWEGFCLLHRLIERHRSGRSERRSAPVPPGWREIRPKLGCPWVVVDTYPDGKQFVRQLGDEEFAAEFEPVEQAERRREALLVWARHHLASADADHLRLNIGDLDRPPWNDPILGAEWERITRLVQDSGLPYDQTFDPKQPDRELRTSPPPATLRVTAEVAAVLRVLLDRPGERLRAEEVRSRSGLSWKAARVLWRLKDAGWAEQYTDEPGATDSRLWWLTETGLRLGRQRLKRRATNTESR